MEKVCESEVLDQHFHSEEELQVELYSCRCCNDEEPCPHGYGYKEVDVSDFDGQSTITLSKTQKKLERAGKEKEV